jgi:hypothetical protein
MISAMPERKYSGSIVFVYFVRILRENDVPRETSRFKRFEWIFGADSRKLVAKTSILSMNQADSRHGTAVSGQYRKNSN